MPILGILASSNQQGRGGGPVGAYDSLATVTVPSGGVASITFTGIPTGYKHLQIRGLLRTNRGLAYDSFNLTANGGTSYSCHLLEGDGGSASAAGAASQTSINYNGIAGNGGTANSFAAIVLDVLDYSNTTTNKTFRYLHGYDLNGSGKVTLASGAALSTSPISSLTFVPQNSSLFVQYSTLAIYGVK